MRRLLEISAFLAGLAFIALWALTPTWGGDSTNPPPAKNGASSVAASSSAAAVTSPASPTRAASADSLEGSYNPLSLLMRFKLASAYYVNPDAVKNLQTAYCFDPKKFNGAPATNALWGLAVDGEVSFGTPNPGNDAINAVSLSSLVKANKNIKDPKKLSNFIGNRVSCVIYKGDSLLGKNPSYPIAKLATFDFAPDQK